MAVVKAAVDAVAAKAPRVSVVLKADVRPGVTGALTAKVEAVERYLQVERAASAPGRAAARACGDAGGLRARAAFGRPGRGRPSGDLGAGVLTASRHAVRASGA